MKGKYLGMYLFNQTCRKFQGIIFLSKLLNQTNEGQMSRDKNFQTFCERKIKINSCKLIYLRENARENNETKITPQNSRANFFEGKMSNGRLTCF